MAEWSIAAVLKTVVLRGTGGSNPSLSAISAENQHIANKTPNFTLKNVEGGVFVLNQIGCNPNSLKKSLCLSVFVFMLSFIEINFSCLSHWDTRNYFRFIQRTTMSSSSRCWLSIPRILVLVSFDFGRRYVS